MGKEAWDISTISKRDTPRRETFTGRCGQEIEQKTSVCQFLDNIAGSRI